MTLLPHVSVFICLQCIYAWLERKNTCPLCESPMDLQDDILL